MVWGGPVTNQLAIILVVAIVGAVAADAILNGADASLFLARKFSDLLEWVAFWR